MNNTDIKTSETALLTEQLILEKFLESAIQIKQVVESTSKVEKTILTPLIEDYTKSQFFEQIKEEFAQIYKIIDELYKSTISTSNSFFERSIRFWIVLTKKN